MIDSNNLKDFLEQIVHVTQVSHLAFPDSYKTMPVVIGEGIDVKVSGGQLLIDVQDNYESRERLEEEIGDLREEVEDLEEQVEDLERESGDLQNDVDSLNRQNSFLEDENLKLQAQIRALEAFDKQ